MESILEVPTSARSVVAIALVTLAVPQEARATCTDIECKVVEVVTADCKPVDKVATLYVAIAECEQCCSTSCDTPPDCDPSQYSSSCMQEQARPQDLSLLDDQKEWAKGDFVEVGECDGKQLFRFDGELEVGKTYKILVRFSSAATVTVVSADELGGCSVAPDELGGCSVGSVSTTSPLLLCLLAVLGRRRRC